MSNLSLEKLVAERNYSEVAKKIPSQFALNFINFIKLVNGGSEENKSSIIHLDMLEAIENYNNVLIVSFRGSAKALPLSTRVCTVDGNKFIGDIKLGDTVIDRYGKHTKVIHVSKVFTRPCYKISLEDGRFVIVSEDHINIVMNNNTGKEYELSTVDLINKGLLKDNKYKWSIPCNSPIEYDTDNDYRYSSIKKKEYLFKGLLFKNKIEIVDDKSFVCRNFRILNKVVPMLYSLGKNARISRVNNRYLVKLSDKDTVNIVNIEYYDNLDCKCIEVNSNSKSYLTSNYIVTHNTTVMAEYMILYIATFGKLPNHGTVDVGMYVGDTMENGVKSLRNNLEFRYNNSEFLKKYVPTAKFTDSEWEFINIEGHRTTFRGFGATSGIRGFKRYGKRPTFAILDDLMSDKNATSDTIIEDLEEIIYKGVRNAMHMRKRKIVWIGTPFNKRDPLYKAAGTKAWNTRVYPICEQFPCKREEFKGAWDDRFNYDDVVREYNILKDAGKVDAFNQELMLRILSDDDKLILDSDIQWYSREEVLNKKSNYNWYITTDFAVSEKQKADYTVISVWAVDSNMKYYWVDGIVARQDINTTIDDLFRLVVLYNPFSVGIEVTGQQQGFVHVIKREMEKRNIWFRLASHNNSNIEGIRPNTNKLVRFNTVVPWFKQKKMYFPKEFENNTEMIEAMEELKSVTPSGFKSRHDDFADTISMLPLLMVVIPNSYEDTKKPTEIYTSTNYFNTYILQEEASSSYIV